jgi:hypothetical protein
LAALISNSASNNTAVGYQAGYTNTTNPQNTFVGYQSGYSSTGGYNTAIGHLSGYAITTGEANTAIGRLVMSSGAGVTGSANTAVGNNTLPVLTSGASNSSLGDGALLSNTTGSNNTALGATALRSNLSASNNTAVGYQAGYTSTVSANSVVLGYQAGFTNTQGSSNTLLGYQAGYTMNPASAINTINTFVGYGAGYSVTTGTNNTILGSYSGNQGGLDIRTASNYIVLSDGAGNPRGIFDNTGNFVVGAPAAGNINNNAFWTSSASAAGYFGQNHENGTASGREYAFFSYNGTPIGSITQNGTTGVLYNITSDYRLKTVIGPVANSGQRIDSLQPVEYTWKADGSRTRGFLAHQFQEVYANSVSGVKDAVDEEGKPVYQSMQASTSEVIADLIAEIQDLRKRLAAAGI